jgi:hypothetical protein
MFARSAPKSALGSESGIFPDLYRLWKISPAILLFLAITFIESSNTYSQYFDL